MVMDIDDDDDIRGRPTLSSNVSSRSSSISSSTSSRPYHEHMEMKNDLLDVNIQEPIDSSQLSYQKNSDEGTSCYGALGH